MDSEVVTKRITELEKKVVLLEERLNNQMEWNETLLRRIGNLERGTDGGKKAARAS
jgi:hypothetical protein